MKPEGSGRAVEGLGGVQVLGKEGGRPPGDFSGEKHAQREWSGAVSLKHKARGSRGR